jgi:2-hydroxychromene-2-carboxylate isomerase
MADLDFFFDPVCPWAWITSRWVAEVQSLRNYDVSWKFISLKFLNEDKMDYSKMPAGYAEVHASGTSGLRVAAHARAVEGNEAVGKVYTALGTSMHNKQERELFVADTEGHVASLLKEAGLPVEWAKAVHDESFDALIRQETELALERTGKDVGTPIITFHPGGAKEASFFGPVISTIPRGEDALKLWDAIETVATTSGMAELKRSLRARPSFD